MRTSNGRQVVVRIWGEETRRYCADVVVEVPNTVSDEQIEAMPLRSFDGVLDLDWRFSGSTGIWPGSCARRLQPEVLENAEGPAEVHVRLVRSARGNVVVSSCRPKAGTNRNQSCTKGGGLGGK